MLTLQNLNVWYGAAQALFDVSLHVASGELLVLQGLNGAGKSTLLQAVMGLGPRSTGRISYCNQLMTGWPPQQRAQAGLGYVAEGRRLFTGLTVQENLRVAARGDVAATEAWVLDLFPALKTLLRRPAAQMSGGEQQMLAIARALMGNPRVLLMDEPSEGLAPLIVAEVGRTIARLKAAGQSIVLVEQNLKLALDLADDVVMLNTGRVVFTGGVEQVRNNEALLTQHLGVF